LFSFFEKQRYSEKRKQKSIIKKNEINEPNLRKSLIYIKKTLFLLKNFTNIHNYEENYFFNDIHLSTDIK